MYQITVKGHFSAAHFLENYEGLCGSVHGHRWEVELSYYAQPDGSSQMVVDFSEMKDILNELMNKMDHSFLLDPKGNEVSKEFYALAKKHGMRVFEFSGRTTAENIARYIWHYILGSTGWNTHVVTVFEAPGNSVKYDGNDWD